MAAWRWMFLAKTVPALIYRLFAFQLPEFPRFLVARGDYDKASQVLYDFTGIVNVNLKIEEIRSTFDSEKREFLSDLRGPALGLRPIEPFSSGVPARGRVSARWCGRYGRRVAWCARVWYRPASPRDLPHHHVDPHQSGGPPGENDSLLGVHLTALPRHGPSAHPQEACTHLVIDGA